MSYWGWFSVLFLEHRSEFPVRVDEPPPPPRPRGGWRRGGGGGGFSTALLGFLGPPFNWENPFRPPGRGGFSEATPPPPSPPPSPPPPTRSFVFSPSVRAGAKSQKRYAGYSLVLPVCIILTPCHPPDKLALMRMMKMKQVRTSGSSLLHWGIHLNDTLTLLSLCSPSLMQFPDSSPVQMLTVFTSE